MKEEKLYSGLDRKIFQIYGDMASLTGGRF